MRKVWSAGLGIALLGAGWWAGARHYAASGGSQSTPSLAGRDSQHARGTAQGDTGADGEEVVALRAQLRERDKVLGAMVLRGALAQQAADGTRASAETKPSETPTARAIGQLNQRLFAADSRPLEARDVQAAVEVATHDMPNSVKATVACSSELCRVSIEGTEDQLDRNSGQFVERLPKKFAGTIVLPDGEGRRLVFAATRQEVLSVSDEPAEK